VSQPRHWNGQHWLVWDGHNWVPEYPPPPEYAPTPYAYPYPYPQAPGTSGLAIASLVLGILWIWGVGSLLAVIFGHVSRSQIRRGERTGGAGMALAGLILGYIGLAAILVIIIVAVSVSNTSCDPNTFGC
jgi:uncharacterized protein DUF4190